jgi:hypothetical protein
MTHLKGDGWWETRKPGIQSRGARLSFEQDAEKSPSAALLSSFVVAAYIEVRLPPQDFERLASGHF